MTFWYLRGSCGVVIHFASAFNKALNQWINRMQALIYSTTSAHVTKALPRLIETIWKKGNKILIYCADKANLEAFDNLLWSYDQLSFLPHVLESDELVEKTPIVLVSEEINPNQANILVCLNHILPAFIKQFEKLVYMYNLEDPDNLQKAKSVIEQLKLNSIEVIEYQQTKTGVWHKLEQR